MRRGPGIVALVASVLALACGGPPRAPEPREGAASPPPRDTTRPSPATPVQFVDVAAESGLAGFRFVNGRPDKPTILEAVGGGVAFLDYDGDGRLDVYFTNGSTFAGFPMGGEPRDALFRNRGDGTFEDVTLAAGVADTGWTFGLVAADYDNDGLVDIYLCNFGPNVLYRNRGDGTFEDVTKSAGVGDPRWSTAASFFDMDLDGDLDLYVANYIDWDDDIKPLDPATCNYRGLMVAYGPRGLKAAQDTLYRNEGDGRFTDVTRQAGIVDTFGYGFQPVAFDPDGDGDLDLFVANDSVANFLWMNDGTGRFEDDALLAGVAFNDHGKVQACMGVGVGDAQGDGLIDLFVTNFTDDYSTLYFGEPGGYFRDGTGSAGLIEPTFPMFGWGCAFLDVDNDGDQDLFEVNGHVYPQVDSLGVGITYLERNQLFENDGSGAFRDVSLASGPGMQPMRGGRGAAFGDYDDDGDVDVAVTNIDAAPTLLRNDGGNARSWVKVRLVGHGCGRDAVGATVTVASGSRRSVQVVESGTSFASSSDPRLHFGLGDAERADEIVVRWPGGAVETVRDVAARQLVTIEQGKGVVAFRPLR